MPRKTQGPEGNGARRGENAPRSVRVVIIRDGRFVTRRRRVKTLSGGSGSPVSG